MLEFDDEASRAVEELYGTADVVEQRRVVMAALSPRPGERALDIGCGPGLLACQLARAVGPGGRVHGIDISPSMLAIAERRDCGPGAAPVELTPADVGGPLPLDDGSVNLAVATQVYEYVPDVPAALAEARRVLAPDGRLLVLDTDWDSVVWRSRDDTLMARVLAAWDEHLAHRELPRRLPQLLREAGFAAASASVVPMLNVGYARDTFSGGLLELIAAYVPGRAGVDAADAEAWAADLRDLGADYFFSVNRFMFLATAEGGGAPRRTRRLLRAPGDAQNALWPRSFCTRRHRLRRGWPPKQRQAVVIVLTEWPFPAAGPGAAGAAGLPEGPARARRRVPPAPQEGRRTL